MPIPTNETELKKFAERLAKLKVNGVSDNSIKTIGSLTDVEWNELQDATEFQEALEKAKATVEILPIETDISIRTLEKQALAATIRNVTSGLATPEYVLEALKYATKVRLEERKQEQDRKTAFTANTQIVINMSDLLKKAIEAQPVSEKIIDFQGENRSITNGLDTDRLLAAAMGSRPQDQVGERSTTAGEPSASSTKPSDSPASPASPYPPAHVNSYNPSSKAAAGSTVPQRTEQLVITDDALEDIDEMKDLQDILFRPANELGE